MCWMWLSAVLAEMNSRSEISRVEAPSAISRRTCVSRAVRPAGPSVAPAAGERASGHVDLVHRVGRGVLADPSPPPRGGPPVRAPPRRARRAAARRAPAATGRGGSWPAAGPPRRAACRRRPAGRVARTGRAGWPAVIVSWATAPARRKVSIASANSVNAVSSCPSEVCSRAASRAMNPAKNRTSCSLEVGHALVPGLQRARRVRLRQGQADDPRACRPPSTGCRARAPPRAPPRSARAPPRPGPPTGARRRTPRSRTRGRLLGVPRPRGSARHSGGGSRSRPPRGPR